MKIELLSHPPAEPQRNTPLLFVHGKWHGAWCWAEYFLPFFAAQGYPSYALSLRGHGRSEGKIRGSRVMDYLADIEQAAGEIRSRHASPVVLIGHSMGGFLTQKYLERVTLPAAVLLASVPPYGLWGATLSLLRRRPGVLLKTMATLRLYPVVETPALAREALFSAEMPEEMVRRYHAQLCDESFRVYLDELGLNLVRSKQVTTPLLVLGAQNDGVISNKMTRDTARAYGVEAEFFPQMAHDMMLEAGWQQAAQRIAGWLQERGL